MLGKKFVCATAVAVMCLGGGAAAYAEISASATGASGWTNGDRASMTIKDTKADNHSAEGRYKRGSTNNATQRIKASGGNGSSATSGTSGAKIVSIEACAVNNNPLDGNICSGWVDK